MDATLRVRDKWLIFNIVPQLWADVKYHVPTRFGFSPKASGFYSFGDATALAGEGGVGGVVWLIQASASNHKPKGRFFWFVWFAWNQTCHSTNDKCEALASLKGCFLCFCFSPPVFFHWTASFACMELTIISRFQRLIKNWFGLFLRFFYGCWWSKCLIFNSIITHCAKIW